MFVIVAALAIIGPSPDRPVKQLTVDFNGPPFKQAVVMENFTYTFSGTDFKYESGGLSASFYDPSRISSHCTYSLSLKGIQATDLGNGVMLVQGYAKDGKFYPALDVVIEAKTLSINQMPTVKKE